jgi:predicted TIM-barrel fold metal-dependent hydrolase
MFWHLYAPLPCQTRHIFSTNKCSNIANHSSLCSKSVSAYTKTDPDSITAARMAALIDRMAILPDRHDTANQTSTDPSVHSVHSSIAERLPHGAWDSHMHVVDPDRFPLSPGASYQPRKHTLTDAIKFESSVGISNIVLVQPSIYGCDNSCLLEALTKLGPHRARGVVVCDDKTTTLRQLSQWHELGVRGIRLNYVSNGSSYSAEELHRSLYDYAKLVRPLGWVLQIYIPMSLLDALIQISPVLGVKICIDHMGYPSLPDEPVTNPYSIPGFQSLVNLLGQKNVYVKLSAPYRISKVQSQADLDIVAKEIIRLRGMDRVVFATDWPHTRFEGLDIRPWMEKVLDWCAHNPRLRDRLFVQNAEDLWDVQQ